MDEGTLKEEILFSTELVTISNASDVLAEDSTSLQEHNLPWEKLVGVCSDSARTLLQSRPELMRLAIDNNPTITGTRLSD